MATNLFVYHHSLKHLLLCSTKENKSYRCGTMTNLHNYAICSFYYGTHNTQNLHYPLVPKVIPWLFKIENNQNNAYEELLAGSSRAFIQTKRDVLFYIIMYFLVIVTFIVTALTSQVCPPDWTSPDTTHSSHVYMCNISLAWHNNSNSATLEHNSKACTTSDSIINLKGHEELTTTLHWFTGHYCSVH